MTNAALIQRCVDIPHDETPTKHGSHEQFVCARRRASERARSRARGENDRRYSPPGFKDGEKTARSKSNSYTNTCTIIVWSGK